MTPDDRNALQLNTLEDLYRSLDKRLSFLEALVPVKVPSDSLDTYLEYDELTERLKSVEDDLVGLWPKLADVSSTMISFVDDTQRNRDAHSSAITRLTDKIIELTETLVHECVMRKDLRDYCFDVLAPKISALECTAHNCETGE